MISDRIPGEPLEQAIAKASLDIYRRSAGRRPITRAHTSEDLVVVVFEDTMTRGERTLSEQGLHQEVLAYQKALQEAMRPDFESAVESLTGRRVCAFMSTTHVDPDYAVEVMVLVPDPDREPPKHLRSDESAPWEGTAGSSHVPVGPGRSGGTPPARRPLL